MSKFNKNLFDKIKKFCYNNYRNIEKNRKERYILELLKENTSRKIDSLGRVSIPKSMRDRLVIKPGEEVEFYLLQGDDGK